MIRTTNLETRREILINIRNQYQSSDWLGKSKLLDGFIAASGYDRKYAKKLLNSTNDINKPPQTRKSKVKYDEQVKQTLIVVWYSENQICAKRLVPFIPELVSAMERHGHLRLPADVREKLLGITKENIPILFELEKYVEYQPLLDFIKDESRSSFMVEAMHSRALAKKNLWLSVSCSKIDFLGTPSVMFYLRDITELKKRELELEKASNTDPLTHLLNRRGFSAKANEAFSDARKLNQPLAVAMCDLDFFKRLNDTFGHDFGDDVLIKFSENCMKSLRDQDVVARFGGEEFVILLSNTPMDVVLSIMERFRETWQVQGENINNEKCSSTVSIGVTQIMSSDSDIDDMIKRADKMLYVCKESGRNNVSSDTDKDSDWGVLWAGNTFLVFKLF